MPKIQSTWANFLFLTTIYFLVDCTYQASALRNHLFLLSRQTVIKLHNTNNINRFQLPSQPGHFDLNDANVDVNSPIGDTVKKDSVSKWVLKSLVTATFIIASVCGKADNLLAIDDYLSREIQISSCHESASSNLEQKPCKMVLLQGFGALKGKPISKGTVHVFIGLLRFSNCLILFLDAFLLKAVFILWVLFPRSRMLSLCGKHIPI